MKTDALYDKDVKMIQDSDCDEETKRIMTIAANRYLINRKIMRDAEIESERQKKRDYADSLMKEVTDHEAGKSL